MSLKDDEVVSIYTTFPDQEIAKKIGMRTRTHLQKEKKLLFCPHCGTPYSSSSVKIRINSRKKQINYLCKNCNKIKKKGY